VWISLKQRRKEEISLTTRKERDVTATKGAGQGKKEPNRQVDSEKKRALPSCQAREKGGEPKKGASARDSSFTSHGAGKKKLRPAKGRPDRSIPSCSARKMVPIDKCNQKKEKNGPLQDFPPCEGNSNGPGKTEENLTETFRAATLK